MKRGLLVIDFINEIVDPNGRLAAKGYADFIRTENTIQQLNDGIARFRHEGAPVIFVRLAFTPTYADHPSDSPIFGAARNAGILADNTWSTKIHPGVDYLGATDVVVVKNRVSAFHGTGLAQMLRNLGVTDVYIAGVATDLAVEAAARTAHDEDFKVFIVTDACAAANTDDHGRALRFLDKIATRTSVRDL
jgi:nicotinamidase-related amidase